jgi:aminoglycoside phosphotransferase (APT) family kinase protein
MSCPRWSSLGPVCRPSSTGRHRGYCSAIEQVAASFDPSDRQQVADAFVAALRRHHPLAKLVAPPQAISSATSTWVWFVDLTGVNLPVAWQGPLVLRIFRPNESAVAEREDRLSSFLTAQGYPAPATHLRDELGLPPQPFVMQQRLPGRPALELLKSMRIREVVAGLGRLQGELHSLSTANFPLRRLTAVEYLEVDIARLAAGVVAVPADDWLGWLRGSAGQFEATDETDIVVCHGDFHPLNAVADTTDGLKLGIVDWTDACIADRHFDVGRTVAIYRLASILAASPFERFMLRSLRGWVTRSHVRHYQSAAKVRLDRRRLLWWQIVHLYRGWLQLATIAEGNDTGPKDSTTVERFPVDLRDQLLARCFELRGQLQR